MELLEFARGPALTFAITIFIAGLTFRIVSLFLMWRTSDSSEGSARERPALCRRYARLSGACGPRAPTSNARCFH